MKHSYILFICCIICFSCSKDKHNEQKLKDVFGVMSTNTLSQSIEYNLYNANGLELLERERNNLRATLSNSILEQVSVYKDYLKNLEKKKIIATSSNEFQKYFEEENNKVFDSLIAKDIRVNIVYLKLLDDLENLNIEYSKKYNIPHDSLKSYYDLPKIVLSDEVYLKIKELHKDEEKRIQLENRKRNEEMVINTSSILIGLLPAGGTITSISTSTLGSISKGLKWAKNGKGIIGNQNTITKISQQVGTSIYSNKLVGQKIINKTIKILSNENKRYATGKQIISTGKKVGAMGVITGGNSLYSSMNYTKGIEYFKNIENKIEGRIGDYSDGILSVHFQNIRDNIKKNQGIIYRYKELKK